MIKIAELHGEDGMVSFPVEADANWSQEARKLAHVPPLFIKLMNMRDVRETDDLYEMLDVQYSLFCDYVHGNERVTDLEYDEGIALYSRTWEAING
jgi:hypothetical protein